MDNHSQLPWVSLQLVPTGLIQKIMDEKKKNVLDRSATHLYNPTASLMGVLSKRLILRKRRVHAND